jgi:metallo-beta-lactamase class B
VMKSLLAVILICSIHVACYAMEPVDTIKISKDLGLVKISGNAYLHVSYSFVRDYGRVAANGLVFINNKNAFLFDTPWNDSLTKELVSYLKNKMGIEIKGFFPNHWHSDCMGGLAYLQGKGIDSYASQKTIDIARAQKLPVPAHGFSDSLRLFLDNKEIDCYYFGAAHSLDNVVVWIPSEKILFPGCMIKDLNSTNLGFTGDGDLKTYPATIDKLINKFRDAGIVIPGHGQYGGFDLILHTRELLRKNE